MELTAAFIAAQREGDPRRRGLVVNPERNTSHIEPVELRDEQHPPAPADAGSYAALALTLAEHVRTLPTALGAILPAAPPRQYGMKLAGASRFVGRTRDMWRVHSSLHRAESAIITGTTAPGFAQVNGMGGVGKSLLSEEYALRFGAAYPGGVFWLRAMGNDALQPAPGKEHLRAVQSEQLLDLAVALGIPVAGLSTGDVEAALAARLEQANEPFLWVVDDLPSGLDADTVRSWLAPHPLGKSLVTTRSRAYGSIGISLALGVLEHAEAFDLLCMHREPQPGAETDAAHAIVEALGCHPLAVDVAGAALRAQAGLVDFDTFLRSLDRYDSDELEFAGELCDVLPSGHEKSVASTLLRSVRALPEEGRDLLQLASLLAVAPIPVWLVATIFARAFGLPEDGARRRAALALVQVDAASLSERAGDDARTVHTLVSRAIRFHDRDRQRCDLLRSAAVDDLLERLPHLANIDSDSELVLLHARELCLKGPHDPSTTKLRRWVARHDHYRGFHESARRLREQVVHALRRNLGEEHSATLESMSELADTQLEQGELAEARSLREHVATVCGRLFGEEDHRTLASRTRVASILETQGNLADARALHEQILEIRHRLHGEEHPDTVDSVAGLASVLDHQGDLKAAGTLRERVLAAKRRAFGDDHPITLIAMDNLAITLTSQGNLLGAQALQEEALAGFRRTLGTDHPDTLKSMSNLAITLSCLGDRAAARELQETVVAVRRRLLGKEHLDTVTTMDNLACTLTDLGELAEAQVVQEEVLASYRRLLGELHPDTLTSMTNLAGTIHARGDVQAARALLEQALVGSRQVLGETHPNTLTGMNNLAIMLKQLGDLPGARALQEQVLAARRGVLGDKHLETLRSMHHLATILDTQGDRGAARELLEEALKRARDVLGDEHPDTLAMVFDLADMLWALRDFGDAQALYEQALAGFHRVWGPESLRTLTMMNDLALKYRSQGELGRARDLQEQALAGIRRVRGEEHIDTAKCAWTLCTLLVDLGESEAARELIETSLAWLMARAPETLGLEERHVRAHVAELLSRLRR
jgi:tetratricopeptide (TPR) repeat protein